MKTILFVAIAFVFGAGIAVWWMNKKQAQAPAEDAVVAQTTEEIILAHLTQNTYATRSDLLPLVKVSKATLVRVLDELEEQNLVEQVGERKGARYKLR